MKNFLYLLVITALSLNCSGDKTYESVKVTNPITNSSAELNSKIFTEAIGMVDQKVGTLSFIGDKKKILSNFNTFLDEKSEIKAGLTLLSLEYVNGSYYLKGYGEDNKSTMLLTKGLGGKLYTSGITCTTTDCAHNHGCEVKADGTCSPCSGDCKKTTNIP